MTMYAQLGDHQKTSNSSSSTSSQISPSASSSDHNHVKKIDGKLKLGPRKKNKNLDLQQSLMGDVEMNGSKIESIEDQSQKSNLRSNGNHSNGLHSQYENNAVGENNGSSSSMMVSDDDPFYVFKDDLEIKLEMLDDGLQRFERIVQVTDTAVNTHEVKEAKKQLKRHIKNAESTVKDLQTTVRLVEKKRDNFLEINDAELYKRKQFISSSLDRIKTVKSQMNSDSIKSKLLADEKAKSKRRLGLLGAKSEEDEEMEFITKSHANAQLMMQQQDEALDELDDAVVRVGHMAENIHDELGHQNKMLTELEEDLDDIEEQLGLVMGKLGKLLKTKNKWQLGIIMLMTGVVVVLFFLVMYT